MGEPSPNIFLKILDPNKFNVVGCLKVLVFLIPQYASSSAVFKLRLIQIQGDLLFNTRIIIYTFRKLDFLRMNTGNGEMDSQTDCQFPSEEWTGD